VTKFALDIPLKPEKVGGSRRHRAVIISNLDWPMNRAKSLIIKIVPSQKFQEKKSC
jgi:hypothetical protein